MGFDTERLVRRAVSVPLVLGAFWVVLFALPLLLPFLAVVDLLRGSRLAMTRTALFLVYFLGCETVGILVSFVLWCRYGLAGGRDGPGWLAAHYRLQSWWAGALLRGASRIFGLRIEVEGAEQVPADSGPFLLFLRHVSFGDTVLAAVYLSERYGHRLRYVLKRELLWDPCLDIVGHRLPNYFVKRGAEATSEDVERVRSLARELGPNEGVLIYPEGTRFTPKKRETILARMEAKGDLEALARARALRNVLPPRLGGALALLEAAPDTDVVFCAHVGFEGTMRGGDLLAGKLVGTRVQVAFWRRAADSIPRTREGRIDWLFEQWREIDDWVAEHGMAAGEGRS